MAEQTPTILVVDDDYDIRDTLADVLEQEGFHAAFAADGDEALRWLRTHPHPCVILLDWMMPRCDGPTFRAAQKADPALADIPVVLLTADLQSEQKAAAIGAIAVVAKPSKLATLTTVLERTGCR